MADGPTTAHAFSRSRGRAGTPADFDGNDSGWAENYGEAPTSQFQWESYFAQEVYLLVQSASRATGTYTLTLTEVAADAPTP